ncbi:MAG: 6,7-dimethyl-8-ribityllumazine synthase [Alphaproteobacteria bacterium]|nr:6,7-dimethyl-8-ribityllumazine synthase [Alphaproteobacteria bacterium]
MPDAPHVMIVEAPYYAHIIGALTRAAVQALDAAGASHERFAVPGAFEIPAAIRIAIEAGRQDTRRLFDGYLALGCVIRGETTHYDYVCAESARGLQALALEYGAAIGYGILTVENEAQALARATIDGKNKGGEAARACLAMIALRRQCGLDRS